MDPKTTSTISEWTSPHEYESNWVGGSAQFEPKYQMVKVGLLDPSVYTFLGGHQHI
jgi:hypothetical protein